MNLSDWPLANSTALLNRTPLAPAVGQTIGARQMAGFVAALAFAKDVAPAASLKKKRADMLVPMKSMGNGVLLGVNVLVAVRVGDKRVGSVMK